MTNSDLWNSTKLLEGHNVRVVRNLNRDEPWTESNYRGELTQYDLEPQPTNNLWAGKQVPVWNFQKAFEITIQRNYKPISRALSLRALGLKVGNGKKDSP